MGKRITLNEARRRLKKLAAERPDYVYAPINGVTCAYFHQDGPGCIVGTAFAAELTEASINYGHSYNTHTDVSTLAEEGVLNATDAAVQYLARAQVRQDQGVPWGKAVKG